MNQKHFRGPQMYIQWCLQSWIRLIPTEDWDPEEMFSSGITSINLILIQSNINETSAESHPLNTLALQLVHKTQLLTDYSFKPKNIIKEIDKNLKDSHDESLKIQFDLQNKLQCYSTLNRTTTFVNDLLI